MSDGMDGMDGMGLSYTTVTPRASLQSDANNISSPVQYVFGPKLTKERPLGRIISLLNVSNENVYIKGQ